MRKTRMKIAYFPLIYSFQDKKNRPKVRKQKMEGMNACHHDFPLLQVSVMWGLSFYKINERRFILSSVRNTSAITSFFFRHASVGTLLSVHNIWCEEQE